MFPLASRSRSFLFAATVVGLLGCAHHVAAPPPNVAPDAEPAPPRDWKGAEAMNTEFWLGNEAEERATLEKFSLEINDIQKKQAADHEQPVQRGFHAKSHGCLWGEMKLRPNRDPRTRFGIFADRYTTHPVVVRFSNGVGWAQSDRELDARGMAVKVLGVDGPKYSPDEEHTQDFLMTNTPTPVGANGEEFMAFAHANASGFLASMLFLVSHPRTGAPALMRTGTIPSIATEQYWSGGAYHLGAHQAIKYTAKPCDGSPTRTPSKRDPDYLEKDLFQAAARPEGTCYTFYVQFQVDPERTPIENASKEWDADVAPIVPVADIVMPSQDLTKPAERADRCKAMSFNPWHAIPAHKPMGHINRARRYVYASSRQYRSGGFEPTNLSAFGAP